MRNRRSSGCPGSVAKLNEEHQCQNKVGDAPLKKRIQPHIRLGEGDVAKVVFIAGNPDRIPKIAAKMKDAEELRYFWDGYSLNRDCYRRISQNWC
jgi:hypothetical protein